MNNNPIQNPLDPSRLQKRKAKNDIAALGFVLAVLFPLLALVVLYFLWFGSATPFHQYLSMFVRFDNPYAMNNASKVVSLALIANLIPFYFFLNKKKYLTVKGILVGSALFVLLIVFYKFIWQ
jgi:hypothetical protein